MSFCFIFKSKTFHQAQKRNEFKLCRVDSLFQIGAQSLQQILANIIIIHNRITNSKFQYIRVFFCLERLARAKPPLPLATTLAARSDCSTTALPTPQKVSSI